MPGSQPEENPEGPWLEDLDDIQTLQNLLELRSFLKKQKNPLDESLD